MSTHVYFCLIVSLTFDLMGVTKPDVLVFQLAVNWIYAP